MIPIIRSLSELMALTESKDIQNNIQEEQQIDILAERSCQSKRYLRSVKRKKVELPDLSKSLEHKWMEKKAQISGFFDELDYNNQIQSSYDLTLQERQNNNVHKDAA